MDISILIAMPLVVAVTGLLTTRFASLRRVLEDLGTRAPQIDGLRGLCALGVGFEHLAYLAHWKHEVWTLPASDRLAPTIGGAGVAMFFLVCAWLFWGRLAQLESEGPRGWLAFADNRVRRIVPMYVVAMTLAIVFAGLCARPVSEWRPAGELLANGLKAYSFFFVPPANFNGVPEARAALNVAWTLRYEWLFYASLPLLALLRIRRQAWLVLPALLLVNELWSHQPWVPYFLYGALVRESMRWPAWQVIARTRLAGLASVALVLGTCLLSHPDALGRGFPALALSAAFVPIAAGNDWYGALRSVGARLIGACSYSVYLLNLTVLYVLVRAWPLDLLTWPSAPRTLVMAVMMLGVVALSLLTYRSVERPFQRRPPGSPPLLPATKAPLPRPVDG